MSLFLVWHVTLDLMSQVIKILKNLGTDMKVMYFLTMDLALIPILIGLWCGLCSMPITSLTPEKLIILWSNHHFAVLTGGWFLGFIFIMGLI